jgi:hypothetical protein
MAPSSPGSNLPALVAFGLVIAGLAIGLASGISEGSIAGGIVAGLGTIPACVGMWKGIQQETQTTLAMSVVAVLASLAVGGLLIILRIVDMIR